MTGAVTVSPLSADDEAEWRRLWTLYLAFYGASASEAVYAETWRRLVADEGTPVNGFIARADGGAIGLVHYLFHFHCWRVEQVCYLQDLYVDDAARGVGAGRALIEAVYRAADAAGAGDVYWMTQEGNSAARKLYDRVAVATDFMKYRRG